jgi:hypothetical protein
MSVNEPAALQRPAARSASVYLAKGQPMSFASTVGSPAASLIRGRTFFHRLAGRFSALPNGRKGAPGRTPGRLSFLQRLYQVLGLFPANDRSLKAVKCRRPRLGGNMINADLDMTRPAYQSTVDRQI